MATVTQTAPHPIFLPRFSPFGYDFAPPRQSYITFIPAILILAGLLSWVMGDESGMVLAATVASAVAIYTLWNWLFRGAPTRFSTLMGMSLLLGYGGGTLNTWMTLPRSSLTLAAHMGLPEDVLAHGMGAVLIATAPLFFFGEIYERPMFGRDFRVQIDARTRTLIRAGTLGMLAGYATRSLSFAGPTSGGGHVSIPGLFLTWLYTPLTAIAVASFLTAEHKKDKLLDGLSALILLMMFSIVGRRDTIYTTVEILFVLRLVGFRWRGNIARNALLVLGLAAIVVVGSLTFMLLRIVGFSQRKGWMPVEERITAAGKIVQKGGAYSMAAQVTQNNLQRRTFVLPFLANILDASSRTTPALGNDALGMLQLAVPSVIYPDKDIDFSEEALVDRQFGFAYGDQPNSMLTAGATDFGLIGMILYPLITVFVSKAILNFIARWLSPVPLLFVTLSFILTMLLTEATINAYLETVRNAGIFGLVLIVFMALPRIRSHA
jgi:hypothetical protein